MGAALWLQADLTAGGLTDFQALTRLLLILHASAGAERLKCELETPARGAALTAWLSDGAVTFEHRTGELWVVRAEARAGRVRTVLSSLAGETEPQGDAQRLLAFAARLLAHSRWADAEMAEIRRDAATDPLTGLWNRRAFDRLIESVAHRTDPVHLAILDADKFKEVNDRLGHVAGDELLRELGQILVETFPGAECVCRLGGDEFGIVVIGGEPGCLDARLDLARERFVALRESRSVRGSFTFGVGTLEGPFRPGHLLAAADQALLAAKRSQRKTTPRRKPAAAGARQLTPELALW